MNSKIKEIKSNLSDSTAALILSPQNRYYLTRFHSSEGAVIITENAGYLLVDSRYYEAARKKVSGFDIVLISSLNSQINEILKENGIRTLLLESDYVTLDTLSLLEEKLSVNIDKSDALQKLIKNLRKDKDKEEFSSIVAAQEITDKTFSYICEHIKVGRTEKEIMLQMEMFSRKSGSEGVAFDFIVVSGKNTSLPHGVPSDKKIQKGDLITMDFGATVNGYKSDMTRTVAVGSIDDGQKTVYDTVLKAQTAAICAAKPGVKCSLLDKTARDIIDNAGYKGYFGHALGHGVGIDIHEAPTLSPKSEETLKAGNVITVEPGIYIPEKFGVRIEDMLYITDNGNINLTNSSKELIIL